HKDCAWLRTPSGSSATQHELIAAAAYGFYQVVSVRVGGKFSSQAADVHIEAAIERIEFAAEHRFRKLLALDYLARRAHQHFEQRELDIGEIERLTRLCRAQRSAVEYAIFDHKRGSLRTTWRCGRRRPAMHGTDARQQLPGVEGFRQVVVSAHLQADDAVDLFTTRREQHDTALRKSTNLLEDCETIQPGQHDIEQNHGPLATSRSFHARIAAMHSVDPQIITAEVLRQHFAKLHIVVDQQDGFHRNGHTQPKPCAPLRL